MRCSKWSLSTLLQLSRPVWLWKHGGSYHLPTTTFCVRLHVRIFTVCLHACFPCKHSTLQLRRERMWAAYHRLSTSNTFVGDWREFHHPVIYNCQRICIGKVMPRTLQTSSKNITENKSTTQ